MISASAVRSGSRFQINCSAEWVSVVLITSVILVANKHYQAVRREEFKAGWPVMTNVDHNRENRAAALIQVLDRS
jgi:phage pi2 protein 07